MLVYLDQNYASRLAKYVLAQPGHDHFGRLLAAIERTRPCLPPSPFHVLETRGGYLLPTMRGLFAAHSSGLWVRPWQEVVARQAARAARGIAGDPETGDPAPGCRPGGSDARGPGRGGPGRGGPGRGQPEPGDPAPADLLAAAGSWDRPASLEPLEDLLELPLEGGFFDRCADVRAAVAVRMGVPREGSRRLPFVRLLARLVAFRSLDAGRGARPSDLTDLLMAATVGPYVDVLATDRYLRETLQRTGYDRWAFSGRRGEVLRLAELLAHGALAARP